MISADSQLSAFLIETINVLKTNNTLSAVLVENKWSPLNFIFILLLTKKLNLNTVVL